MIKFSEKMLTQLFRLIIIFAIIKVSMVALLSTLPRTSIDKVTVPDVTLPYLRFDVKNAFYIHNENRIKKPTKPQEPLYKIDNMELTGIYRESETNGFIVFYDKRDRKQHILSVGEVYKGYRLEKITPQEGIFVRNNKRYRLSFKNNLKKSVQSDNVTKIEKYEDEPARIVPKTLVTKYTSDFKAIWKDISIKEEIKNGKIDGFKIRSIKRGSVFEELGLKKGDIIIAVNDKPIKTYKAAFDIYQNILKYSDIKIKILRNGVEKEFEYEIH